MSDTGRLVRVERRGTAAWITLDSPGNRNALSKALVEALHESLDEAATDPAVRAVVLTATGRTFCAGADLTDPPVSSGRGSIGAMLRRLWELPKPVVAGINGHVRAGGLGLVAAADMATAVESSTFAFTEVRLGLVPAMISVLCLRKMTPTSASRYLLTGEQFGPSDAVAAGLVGRIVPDTDLDGSLESTVDEFRLCEPNALSVTKDLLRRIPLLDPAEGMDHAAEVTRRMFGSAEAAEGIAAFKEKRPPRWAAAPT